MKPLCKWSGGKRNEIPRFNKYFPTNFTTYIEPFVGGGAVFFDLNFEGQNVINDIHPELINFYKMIADGHTDQMIEILNSWGTTEKDYYFIRGGGKRCKNKDCFKPKDDIEKAAQFYYLRKTCFRGMMRYNSDGEFNIPYGKYKKVDFKDLSNKKYKDLLQRTQVNLGDYKKIFEEYNSTDNFVFLDPPYDSEFNDYGFDDFNKQSQKQLSEIFKTTKNKCMMVIAETPLIKELYDGYIVDQYPKKYAFKIYGGRIGDEIDKNHLVILNYKNEYK